MSDNVNHPSHYADHCSLECIEVIEILLSQYDEGFMGFLIGNAFKYIWRYKYKSNKLEDLKKALWYLDKAEYNGNSTVILMRDFVETKIDKLESEGIGYQE